jgi:TIR domain
VSVMPCMLVSMTDATSPTPPKAFLSHASEDKADFAEPLGRRLAELGIDPWLDRWEIRPGDSLVQRLFDEGLAHADAVVVVISRFSVRKAWVREELDSATVSRIERGTRLIPVRLDDTEMPSPLKHLVWINATRGADGIDSAAQSIADTLHARESKPLVGPAPSYARTVHIIPGLNVADEFLLTLAIRAAIEGERRQLLDWSAVERQAQAAGLLGANLHESASALAERDYLDVNFRGDQVDRADLTEYGYNVGIRAVLPDFDEARRRVISEIVNDPPEGDRVMHALAERAHVPILLVRQLLEELQGKGSIIYSLALGDHTRLHSVSPTLGREL